MAGNDFCMVQLTEAGIAVADGGPLRVSGRTSLVFTAGQPTRVAKYEWDLMLKNYPTTNGTTLFELVPDVTPAPSTTSSASEAVSAPTENAATTKTSKESK